MKNNKQRAKFINYIYQNRAMKENQMIQKLASVLYLSHQRRDASDLISISEKINDPKGLSYSSFVALYCRLYVGPAYLTHFLEHESQLYLLHGSLAIIKAIQRQKQKVNQPAKIKIKEAMRIVLDDDSIAISITKSQIENCLSLQSSSILEQIQFLKSVQYFSSLSRIVCQNIIFESVIREYHKGDQVPKDKDCLYLVRDGQFESYQNCYQQFDQRKTRYQTALITIGKGLFFRISHSLRCKSAKGTLYSFKDEFVKNYLQVLCGDKITQITDKREKYISEKSKSVQSTKRVCLGYLTQTKFRIQPKIEKKSYSVRRISNIKFKSISSKNPEEGYNNYQQLQKLQSKRNRCFAYKELFPLNLNKKGDILSRMYKSIKEDLQTRDKQKREAKKTLIF